MKQARVLGCLALFSLLALGSLAAGRQELQWPPYRGYDVPFVPTPPEVVDEMLRLADVRTGDILYDLGCGDGRIVIAAAKRYGVKAVGIDIDPVRIAESNDNAAKAGIAGQVRFIEQNLFEADFKDATVVTMYLLTSVNLRLRPKLLTDLKPGTRLVSHSFEMGDWKPDETSTITTSYGDHRDVHFWVVPANVTGRWTWELTEGGRSRSFTLQAGQQFQEVTATGTAGDAPAFISDITLSGARLKFRLDAETNGKKLVQIYEGRVDGDTIDGTARQADNPKAVAVRWKAVRDPKTIETIAKDN